MTTYFVSPRHQRILQQGRQTGTKLNSIREQGQRDKSLLHTKILIQQQQQLSGTELGNQLITHTVNYFSFAV